MNLGFFNPLMPHFVSDTVEDNVDNAEKDIEEGIEHLEDAKDYQVNLDRYIRMISHPKWIWLYFSLLTLKMRSMSMKSNQLKSLSQWCIPACLIVTYIWHYLSWTQGHQNPTHRGAFFFFFFFFLMNSPPFLWKWKWTCSYLCDIGRRQQCCFFLFLFCFFFFDIGTSSGSFMLWFSWMHFV